MKHTQKILCRDILGEPHLVDRHALIKRTSTYAVIQNKQGILLVTDRTSGGQWEFPGGGVDPGEDKIGALRREILEETGLHMDGKPSLVCEFTEYFFDLDSSHGWESTRSFYTVACKGSPALTGNGDDIVAARFFVQPLDDPHVTKVTRLVSALM